MAGNDSQSVMRRQRKRRPLAFDASSPTIAAVPEEQSNLRDGAPPDPQGPGFLEPDALIELSKPRARIPRVWLLLGGFLMVVVLSTLFGSGSPEARQMLEVVSAATMVGLMTALMVMTLVTVRRYRAEQQTVEAIGEMVQLRRWSEAAVALQVYLTRPARSLQLRTQALIFLGSILARYHRFEDAIRLYDHLLREELVDGATAYGLRLGRAMAMLREDHLVDADRAMSELRRMTAGSEVESGGLALLEIYRDVKTGHPAEAIEVFERKRDAIRDQLGHRSSDAWALVARAHDLLGQEAAAQEAFEKATLLAPPPELFRRYPEVQKMQDRYKPAYAPPEAA